MPQPLDNNETVLIIGASHAGIACAEQLRKCGFEGSITILDREPDMPMERPPLSKAWLGDATKESPPEQQRFLLRQEGWFREYKIDFRPDAGVINIDPKAKTATLADNKTLSWQRLVLATGAVPRRLAIEGGDEKSVFYLRVPRDAARLSGAFAGARHVAIIGGGYIGLEVAASARKRGLDVTVLEMAPRLLARVASPEASAFFDNLHRTNGVQIMTGTRLERIDRIDPNKTGLTLITDTAPVEADPANASPANATPVNTGPVNTDMVVVGIGVVPDMALAEDLGIATGNGILVNNNYETTLEDIFAIGDVALPEDGYAQGALRIESVHHAQMSATIAAAAMTGQNALSHEVPWFWSNQYDCKLQSAGLVPEAAETLTRKGRRDGSVSFWSFANDTLKAVEAINDPQAYMIGLKTLSGATQITPAQVASPDFDLKSLLSPK